MAIVDKNDKQLTLKVVYCGPPQGGKASNLASLCEHIDPSHRGRLMTLNGSGDPTLLCDVLPTFFELSGLSIRIKICSVPGQPIHQMTRRAVLRGVDGIVFVADSSPESASTNQSAFVELRKDLEVIGNSTEDLAWVTQFNKRDLPGAVQPVSFLSEHVQMATANQGKGVLETFMHLAESVWANLEKQEKLEEHFQVSTKQFRNMLLQQLDL